MKRIRGIYIYGVLAFLLAVAATAGAYLLASDARFRLNPKVASSPSESDSGWVRFFKPLYGDTINIEMTIYPLPEHSYMMTYQYRHTLGKRHLSVALITDSLGHLIEQKQMPKPFHYVRGNSSVTADGHLMLIGYIRTMNGRYYGQETLHATLVSPDLKVIRSYQLGSPAYYSVSLDYSAAGDGGWYVSGNQITRTDASVEMLLIKLDANLHELWQQSLNPGVDNFGYCVSAAPEDGAYIAGKFRNDKLSQWQVILARYSSSGKLLWQVPINSPMNDYVYGLLSYPDGSGIVGFYRSDPTAMSVNTVLQPFTPDGELKPEIRIPSRGYQELVFLRKSSDGGLLMLSNIRDLNGRQSRLQKISRSGEVQWTRDFLKGYWTITGNMLEEEDHLVFCDYVNRMEGDSSFTAIALIKTDLEGNLLSQSWMENPTFEQERSANDLK